MKYYAELDLDIPLLNSNIKIGDIPKIVTAQLPLEYLNPDILKLFDSLGLNIFVLRLFFRAKGSFSYIHCDLTPVNLDFTRINWVYGGKAKMSWFNLKPNEESIPQDQTYDNVPYQCYSHDQVEEVDQHIITKPTIVQTGCPHLVHDVEEDRYCFSLGYRYKHKEGKPTTELGWTSIADRPTMEETLIIFKNYITM